MTPIAICASECQKHMVKCMVAFFTLVKHTVLEALPSKTHGKTNTFAISLSLSLSLSLSFSFSLSLSIYIYSHTMLVELRDDNWVVAAAVAVRRPPHPLPSLPPQKP